MDKRAELASRLAALTEEQVAEIAEYFLNDKYQALLDALRDCSPEQIERFFNHRFTVELLQLDGYYYAVITALVHEIVERLGAAA